MGKSSKPKICFIATSPFSINAFIGPHIDALVMDFEITVMTAPEDHLARLSLPRGVNHVALDIRRKPSPVNDLVTLFNIWRNLLGKNYLIVMSITPKAGLLAMTAARLAGVRNRLHCFTGQVWATRKGVARTALKLFDRMIVAMSSRVFADGKAQARFLVEQGVVSGSQVSVLGPGPVCGVNLHRFRADKAWRKDIRQAIGIADDAVVALFLGRLHRDKGIYELAEAFVRAKQNTDCKHLVLLCVGPVDDPAIRHYLEIQLPQYGDSLRLVSGVPDPERYIAAADFLVLPSYREGFGMVVLEAAAAAVPAVVSDVYGLEDAVVADVTALRVPVRNVPALASALQRLSTDAELRQRLGQAAAKRVHEEFTLDIVTAAWREMFFDIQNSGTK